MRVSRTIIAGLVFIAALFILFEDRRRMEESAVRRTATVRLLPAPIDQVTGIRIKRTGSTLELRKEEGQWKVSAPGLTNVEADAELVGLLLEYLDKQSRSGAEKLEREQLASFGLDHPPVEATVRFADGDHEFRLMIGADSPLYGEVYARLSDGNESFLVAAQLRELMKLPLRAYRDKSLLPVRGINATTLSLYARGVTVEVVKEGEHWKLVSPIEHQAEDSVIEAILREIDMTRAVDFVDSDTLQLERYGLDAPRHVVTLHLPEDEEPNRATLLIGDPTGADDSTYYARRIDQDLVFTVPGTLVEHFRRATPNTLRSRRLFTLSPAEVRRFSLGIFDNLVELRRNSTGRWVFESDMDAEVDQGTTDHVLQRLLDLTVTEFFTVPVLPEVSGLDEPMIRLVVSDQSGERVEGIETGRLGRSPLGREIVYARIVGTDEVFGIPDNFTGHFVLLTEDFEDRTLFTFNRNLVETVQISQGGLTRTFRREEFGWLGSLEGSDDTYRVESQAIDSLIFYLLDLEWADRLNPALSRDLSRIDDNGLNSPWRTVRFLDKEDEELAFVGRGGEDDSYVYIRRGEEEYFAIEKGAFLRFDETTDELFPEP